MEAPFPQDEELQQKTARLRELNASLNMDEKESVLLDDAPEADDSPVLRSQKSDNSTAAKKDVFIRALNTDS